MKEPSWKKWQRLHPEEVKKSGREYYLKNKEACLKKHKEYYYKNKERFLQLAKNNQKKKLEKMDNDPIYKAKVINHNRQWRREYRAKIRSRTFLVLGSKCVRCGFADSRALQIDHINGGGNQELSYDRGGEGYYLKIVKEVESGNNQKYQLLCANCNWIKRCENNEHTLRTEYI